MKKNTFSFFRLFFLVVALSFGNLAAWATDVDSLLLKIEALPKVSDVKRMASKQFADKFSMFVEQPVDCHNPAAGTFKQRVYLMEVGEDRPTVIVTEGYGASYAAMPNYREELSRILDANVIFVEHRYFIESVPSPLNWKYLTVENAANDHHNITTIFKQMFKGKWIATGISKGGQTALMYRYFFPKDVDVTVCYVAPLCKAREDGRHEPFIRDFVGTAQQREIVKNFQINVLKRRAELQPKFDSLCTANNYKFKLPLNQVYDYSVLEFSFSFWQWGSPISEVPQPGASANEVFKYWMKISSPDYFSTDKTSTPFYVQAARELGYYGYDTKPFKGLLSIKNTEGYLSKIFLPQGSEYKYDKSLYHKLRRFLETTDCKMMFVYGEYDPWSSVKVDEPKRDNVVVFVQPKGSHKTRIGSLPDDLRQKAVNTLEKWLSE